MEKNKKDSSYIGFALICIILGSILLTVGHFIKNDLTKADGDLVDATVKIASYEENNGKINVVCKYGYEGNEYNYVCHSASSKEEAEEKYKIGTEETIKINKANPGKVTILDLRFVIVAIYTIGFIFFFIAILYMINEIIRLAKRNKIFNEELEKD